MLSDDEARSGQRKSLQDDLEVRCRQQELLHDSARCVIPVWPWRELTTASATHGGIPQAMNARLGDTRDYEMVTVPTRR